MQGVRERAGVIEVALDEVDDVGRQMLQVAPGQARILVARQDHDADRRDEQSQLDRHVGAVGTVTQIEVEEHCRGGERADESDRLCGQACLADHIDAGVAQGAAQRRPGEGVVLDDENAGVGRRHRRH